MAGIGKTMLAATLAETIQNTFEYIFWRSLQDGPSVQTILEECIQLFSNHQRKDLPDNLGELISVLIEYLREYRCLIVLDNFESILQAGATAGLYRVGFEGYVKLLQYIGEVKHKSCLVLTSREQLRETRRLDGKSLPVRSMYQPVEKLLAELMRECMSLTAQRWALEGDKRAKTRRRA